MLIALQIAAAAVSSMSWHPIAFCPTCHWENAHAFCPSCLSMIDLTQTYQIPASSSPVCDLLCNNLPPRSAEHIDVTRKTIRSIEKEAGELDQEIWQMYDAFQCLLEKRRALHNHAAAHKGIISPLRRLPSEVLSEIFIHALPPFPFVLLKNEAPLVFERVCKRWRSVSRSTPSLWSSITLLLAKGAEEKDFAIASTCLARAGERPLSLSLGGSPYDNTISPSPHPALTLLSSRCEQWHTVHIQLPFNVIRELSVVNGRLSSLHELSIIAWDDDPEEEEEDDDDGNESDEGNGIILTPMDAFTVAPNLRYLVTDLLALHDTSSTRPLIVPWNNLTRPGRL